MRLVKESKKTVKPGESVVYWMRMEDLRSEQAYCYGFSQGLAHCLSPSRGQHGARCSREESSRAQSTSDRAVCALTRRLQDARQESEEDRLYPAKPPLAQGDLPSILGFELDAE